MLPFAISPVSSGWQSNQRRSERPLHTFFFLLINSVFVLIFFRIAICLISTHRLKTNRPLRQDNKFGYFYRVWSAVKASANQLNQLNVLQQAQLSAPLLSIDPWRCVAAAHRSLDGGRYGHYGDFSLATQTLRH